MRRYSVAEGTLAEIRAELEQYGSDRAQAGKEDKARELARALAALEDPGDEMMVGHTLYRVVED